MRVLVTGAAGLIGSEIVDELSESHELCLLDCKWMPDPRFILADLARSHVYDDLVSGNGSTRIEWAESFQGADVVIHLAADPNPHAPWKRIFRNNIQGMCNVLQAAVRYKISRVIYASSNWAVKALEFELAPACYDPNGPKIGSDVYPRPLTAYGIGKAFGELCGRMLVDERKLDSFVAVRIGWFEPNPPEREDYRRLAIGEKDLRALFRACVESNFTGFHIVYGVSAQEIAPYDLSHTRDLLSWEPAEHHAQKSQT